MLTSSVNPERHSFVNNVHMDTMAERIKQLRLSHGLTQEQLGRMVGVSKVAVSHWENETVSNIRLATFLRLCDALHTSPQFLIFGPEGDPRPARRHA